MNKLKIGDKIKIIDSKSNAIGCKSHIRKGTILLIEKHDSGHYLMEFVRGRCLNINCYVNFELNDNNQWVDSNNCLSSCWFKLEDINYEIYNEHNRNSTNSS